MPKVSVIIPTYNRAEFLRSAITSVLNQTFQDFEILVIDDCSNDHTAEVVSSFADERISYLRNESNKGEGGSRNVGLRAARGEFIGLLDDDDEWLPEKLELQVRQLQSRSARVGAVYTGYYWVDKNRENQWGKRTAKKRGYILSDLLTENWIIPSTLLLRKECFDKSGFFQEGMKFGVDYDMWIRVAKHYEFDCVAAPLVRYYLHGNNVTANVETVIRGIENQLEQYASLWQSNPKGRSQRYLSLGVLQCYAGNPQRAREAFLMSIKSRPIGVKVYLYFCLSLFGARTLHQVMDWKEAMKNVVFSCRVPTQDPNGDRGRGDVN